MIRTIILLALLSARLALPGSTRYDTCGRCNSELRWWIAGSMDKTRPDDDPPENPIFLARLRAARNESEAFQIVLRSEAEPDGFDVEVPELAAPGGQAIYVRLLAGEADAHVNRAVRHLYDFTADARLIEAERIKMGIEIETRLRRRRE